MGNTTLLDEPGDDLTFCALLYGNSGVLSHGGRALCEVDAGRNALQEGAITAFQFVAELAQEGVLCLLHLAHSALGDVVEVAVFEEEVDQVAVAKR